MENRKKGKLLFFSISLLILLLIIYVYAGGRVSDRGDEPTAATFVIECAHKTGDFFTRVYNDEVRRIREAYTAYHAKKTLEVLPGKIASDTAKSIRIKSINVRFTLRNLSRAEYLEPVDIDVPDGVAVPSVVDGTTFKESSDYVFATSEVGLFGSPSFEGKPVRTTEMWEEFLRVGISEDCCYQLVSMSGELLYGNGTNFLRHREDMPLTEEIDLEEERVKLDVRYISQYPSLPNGCEITSLATVLNYYGFDISKEDLAREYLKKADIGEANFYKEFVGDPFKNNSFGCYAPVIVDAANSYLSAAGSPMQAVDLTGSDFKDLLLLVRNGTPVIVWGAANITAEPVLSIEWIVDGEYLIWKTNLHCMVLTGYDIRKNTVIVSDPMRGIREYDMDAFIKRFKQFYSQAVILD
ncbi:MAG: C39 family peptidase [Lachnospiraceae bacterium]|nr:C39 family peptidase [Lachnospiraceae bacterium]